jgi:tetratricopeptide (TPR) repeat protein
VLAGLRPRLASTFHEMGTLPLLSIGVLGAMLSMSMSRIPLGTQAAEECRDGQLSVATTIRELLERGDDGLAREAVAAVASDASCPALELARLSISGWFEARALAAVGGPADTLAPVRAVLDALEKLAPAPTSSAPQRDARALQVEYASTTIRAAVAAAQDERPEMELLLGHARDLVQRLQQRSVRALWPRPFNVIAGELWFEVDRYDDARLAYERAVQSDASAAALVGLARAQARLGRAEQACATYKRARDIGATLREAAKSDLGRCR